MGQSDEGFREFQEAVKPALEWLHRNGDPHQKIIIESDGAELVRGEMGFPANVPD